MTRSSVLAASLLALSLSLAAQAHAEAPPPEFIQFSPSATKGALYRPDPELYPDAHIGVVVMHRSSNFMSHISTGELSDRGFYVLGMNPRCDNNEAACAPWENNALDLAQGVEYLRAMPEIERVVLLGHSGGGPTMSFYQAVAESGPEFCQQEQKLMACGEGFDNLPPADGVILMDAHPGNTAVFLRAINPTVTNDADIFATNAAPEFDSSLDALAAENGFAVEGSNYSPEFIETYTAAQSERANTLIDIALERLAYIEENDLGDAPFIVPLASGANMLHTDTAIHAATENPQALLLDDGTIVSDGVAPSVRTPILRPADPESFRLFGFLTVKSFLSVNAIRSTNSLDGIDWCSSNNSTPCNVGEISVPLLVTAMGGHYFVRDNEEIFEAAASEDKEFVVIDGATHSGTPCETCGDTPDQYANATTNLFDLMADWMNARY